MSKHGQAAAAFLTSALAGGVVAFLAYLFFRKPCPPLTGTRISVGECVGAQPVDDFAQAAGVVCLLVGLAIGVYFEKA